MGKTFRKEKKYGYRPAKLHTHRDLPDIQEDSNDDFDYDLIDEEYFYGKLHTKEQDVVRREDEPSDKADHDERK
jgi:hypothetical protein